MYLINVVPYPIEVVEHVYEHGFRLDPDVLEGHDEAAD